MWVTPGSLIISICSGLSVLSTSTGDTAAGWRNAGLLPRSKTALGHLVTLLVLHHVPQQDAVGFFWGGPVEDQGLLCRAVKPQR